MRRAELAWLLLVAGLVAATLGLYLGVERYVVAGGGTVNDPAFATLGAPGSPWMVEGDPAGVTVADGVLRLTNADPAKGVGVRQRIRLQPGQPHDFRVEAVVASRRIAGSRRGYRVGEVTFVADERIGQQPYNLVHRLAAFSGTRGPERVARSFHFPADSRELELAIRLRYATGSLSLRALKVVGLSERPVFGLAKPALSLAWLAAALAGAVLFRRRVQEPRAARLLVPVAAVSLVLLLLPQTWREALLDPLASALPARVGSEHLADLGHLAIFTALGLLLRLSLPRTPWPACLALLIGLAGITEVLQFLAELRTPSLLDWATNAVGAVAGFVLAVAAGRLRARWRSPETAEEGAAEHGREGAAGPPPPLGLSPRGRSGQP